MMSTAVTEDGAGLRGLLTMVLGAKGRAAGGELLIESVLSVWPVAFGGRQGQVLDVPGHHRELGRTRTLLGVIAPQRTRHMTC